MPEARIAKIERKYSDVVDLALDTIGMSKQALVFVSNKKSAEKCAEDIALKILHPKDGLDTISEDVLGAIAKPTKQCERLARCARKGIAFHHSGLTHKQREIIEDEFKTGKISIICCTPTLCVSGDTRIWQGISDVKVANCKQSSKMMALEGNEFVYMKPEEIHKLDNHKELVQISSVSGHSIKVTPSHKMLIKRKNVRRIVPAAEVRKTDKIATVGKLKIEKTNTPSIDEFIKHNRQHKPHIQFNPVLSYFIGAMLGDGYSGADIINGKIRYKGSPTIVGKDSEVFMHVIEACNLLNISHRKNLIASGTPQLVLGKNNWFREFLVMCGIEQRDKKHISEKLMNLDEDNIIALLRGLFDTDGYVQKHKNVGFSSISQRMVKQMQRLLLRLGIVTRIRSRKASIMKIYEKEYKTAPCFELTINQKRSILDFYRYVGFDISRKQESLIDLVAKLSSNVNFMSCSTCRYKVHKDIFSGRIDAQKKWGITKLRIINLLGKGGEKESRQLKAILGAEPRKNENRLNHHYELIEKRRVGNRQNTEQIWKLNRIGTWIFDNILQEGKDIKEFFRLRECPLCKNQLEWVVKKGWRDADFEGDIFWDVVRDIKKICSEDYVYDIVLPDKPKNDHMLVAEGFIIHNSAGVDLPAFRTIIRDLKRYSDTGWGGMQYIPVLEYLQMAGRAGRPRFDTYGEAIIIASSEDEKAKIHDKYIFGEPEEIYSKLAVEPVLRTYILSLIATEFVHTRKELTDFFSRTFWAYQFRDMKKLEEIIDKMLDLLERYEFIATKPKGDFVSAAEMASEKDMIRPTLLGRRVAQLYIDPLTAHHLLKCIRRSSGIAITPFGLLQMACNTLEMRPLLRVKTSEFDKLSQSFIKLSGDLLQKEPSIYDPEYDDFMNSMKTALYLLEWTEEKDEEFLYEEYDVRPGETRIKIDKADWLLYSAEELAKLMSFHDVIKDIIKLRFRIKYGVKEELIPLLRLKGIGRVRARKLYNTGIKDLGDIKKADITTLGQLIGKAIALDIKKQVGEDLEKEIVPEGKRKGQISLKDYGE
jgi:helicase